MVSNDPKYVFVKEGIRSKYNQEEKSMQLPNTSNDIHHAKEKEN